MYKMAPIDDANNGTFTLIDADGNEIHVGGTFVLTGATETGELTGTFTPNTGPNGAAAVPIPLIGMAKMDGLIAIDIGFFRSTSWLGSAEPAVAFANLPIASLKVVDSGVTANIKGLAKAVKAGKAAKREFRLSLEGEALATTEVKSAVRKTAEKLETLSTRLPTNPKINAAAGILNAFAASAMDDDPELVGGLSAAQEAALSAEQDVSALSAPQNAAALGAGVIAALSSEVTELNQQIIELRNVSSAKTKAKTIKGAATKTVTKTKKVVKKAADKLRKVK